MRTDRPNDLDNRTDRNDLHDVHDLHDLNDPSIPDDLNFLREWREPIPRARIAAAIVGAILYHLAAIAVVVAAFNAPPPNFSGNFTSRPEQGGGALHPARCDPETAGTEGSDATRSQPWENHERPGRPQRRAASAGSAGPPFQRACTRSGSHACNSRAH